MPFTILISLLALFFICTFLQSGIDKLLHPDDNISWFESQFSKSFLAPLVKPLFWAITIQELISGGFLIFALFQLFYIHSAQNLVFGFLICLSTLIQLFFGQRIAKDYTGASGIIPYIIVAILAISLGMFI